ncbi:sensor histidine kinase [Pedobacter sp. AW31-3R]|uniref:sensor histidine kinase n=1 Tax=Pedobacter sp. AW31-3R TaxID=3445781 RepID=UPI003F9F2900
MERLSFKSSALFIRDKKIHFIIWTIYIFYETILIGLLFGEFGSLGNYTVHYTYNILLFYITALYVLPVVMKNPNQVVWKLPLMVVMETLLFASVAFGLDYLLLRYTDVITFKMDIMFFGRLCYRGVFFIGLSTGYYYLLTYLKEKELNVELEKQRLVGIIKQKETENELNVTVNAYLKAQINPHFLFNTLNFIYNNARKTAPEAADAIMTLSEMMRYAIKSEQAGESIYLYAEIEQVENLIHLHQLRQNNKLHIQLDYSGITKDIRFIPLVLVTLLENIFKHGNLSKPSKPALVHIYVADDELHIYTENLVNEFKNNSGEGIGLENVRKRISRNYPGRSNFNYYTEQDHIFKVSIVISLS